MNILKRDALVTLVRIACVIMNSSRDNLFQQPAFCCCCCFYDEKCGFTGFGNHAGFEPWFTKKTLFFHCQQFFKKRDVSGKSMALLGVPALLIVKLEKWVATKLHKHVLLFQNFIFHFLHFQSICWRKVHLLLNRNFKTLNFVFKGMQYSLASGKVSFVFISKFIFPLFFTSLPKTSFVMPTKIIPY